jgi:hypothetical protein
MRFYLALAAACALAGTITTAALADWNDPHMFRESHGDWTNAEYNDGVCHFKYSHDASDNETHVNRWGDCSHVAIGPGGEAVPVVPAILVPDED